MVSCAQEVSKQVSNIIKDNRICLTLGGDHSIGIFGSKLCVNNYIKYFKELLLLMDIFKLEVRTFYYYG